MTNTVGQTQTDHFPQEPQRFLNNMVFESVIFSESLAMHEWVCNISLVTIIVMGWSQNHLSRVQPKIQWPEKISICFCIANITLYALNCSKLNFGLWCKLQDLTDSAIQFSLDFCYCFLLLTKKKSDCWIVCFYRR